MSEKLFGIKIDYIRIDQALEVISDWLKKKGKHFIVTPNPEMLIDAGTDPEFKKALNQASLAIADSPRLGWASKLISSKHLLTRFTYLPFLLFPKIISGKEYPTTTGIDLMEKLISLSEEKTYITAFLGGTPRVADKLVNCLKIKYPKLKIAFCSGNIKVDDNGRSWFDTKKNTLTQSKDIKVAKRLDVRSEKLDKEVRSWKSDNQISNFPLHNLFSNLHHPTSNSFNPHMLSQKIDILFVAFGHKKQEKWMNQNLSKLNARVMVGVGGAFDYISGSTPRAPLILRTLGMEWLFRLTVQPWRIKRFWKLPYFVYKVMTSK